MSRCDTEAKKDTSVGGSKKPARRLPGFFV
jgi:hypothetical protein